jgi:hypothetical protein
MGTPAKQLQTHIKEQAARQQMHHVHAELLQLCYDRKALAAEEEPATCSRARGFSEYVHALRANNFAAQLLCVGTSRAWTWRATCGLADTHPAAAAACAAIE